MAGRAYTKEEDQYILDHYGKESAEYIGEHLGRSKQGIQHRADRLGILIQRKYTAKEEAFIEEHYGEYTIKGLAKSLGRSERSIANKVWRLGLGGVRENADGYSVTDISLMIGVKYNKAWYWCHKKLLKATRKGGLYVVKEMDLIRFLKNNPDRWDATKCTCKWLFGSAEWFQEKRKADFEKMVSNRWGEWYPDAK